MPELPEVETIRRGLSPRIRGTRILDVRTREARVFQLPTKHLRLKLRGRSIDEVNRIGKYLIFGLDHGYLVFHLGMTGQLTLRTPSGKDAPRFIRHPVTGLQRTRQHAPDQHTHLILQLDHGVELLYRDPRKFGKIFWLRSEPESLSRFFSKLGPDPFSGAYQEHEILKRMKGRKVSAKALLLDQSFVAGLGNIYADETLFVSRIHPLRRTDTLRKYERLRIFKMIPRVLAKGVHFGGTSLRDYIDSDGERGTHQERLFVYGRAGQPCVQCGYPITRIVVAQRGTHFCRVCQPRSKPVPGDLDWTIFDENNEPYPLP